MKVSKKVTEALETAPKKALQFAAQGQLAGLYMGKPNKGRESALDLLESFLEKPLSHVDAIASAIALLENPQTKKKTNDAVTSAQFADMDKAISHCRQDGDNEKMATMSEGERKNKIHYLRNLAGRMPAIDEEGEVPVADMGGKVVDPCDPYEINKSNELLEAEKSSFYETLEKCLLQVHNSLERDRLFNLSKYEKFKQAGLADIAAPYCANLIEIVEAKEKIKKALGEIIRLTIA